MRVHWVDVTKFLGIFAIYLGHYQTNAGKAYGFVFYYHVALFFFLSGCMNYYDKEKNIWKYVKKKFKSIMIPFFAFSFLSVLVHIISIDGSLNDVSLLVAKIIRGNIRNEFIASSLWFLSCLFIIEVIFKFIKCIKNRLAIFLICLALFWIANNMINPSPKLIIPRLGFHQSAP